MDKGTFSTSILPSSHTKYQGTCGLPMYHYRGNYHIMQIRESKILVWPITWNKFQSFPRVTCLKYFSLFFLGSLIKIPFAELEISLKTLLALRERRSLDWKIKLTWRMADIISFKADLALVEQWGGVEEEIAERLGEAIWRNLENNSLGLCWTKWQRPSYDQVTGSGAETLLNSWKAWSLCSFFRTWKVWILAFRSILSIRNSNSWK